MRLGNKNVFLYAGQGSQRPGMGKDFYEEYETYREFVDGLRLDLDVKKLMHEGTMEELSQTENTQVCMAVFAAGVTKLLTENGIEPEAACGLSLGEYGALYAAGIFSAEDYLKLVAFRGKVMMEAAKGLTTSMSAILGLDSMVISRIVENYQGNGYVAATNFNCPGQTVICGDEEAVKDVEEKLKEAGAKRCIRLQVSGPFHTKYMKQAGEKLQAYMESLNFAQPKIPIVLNATGDLYKKSDNLKDLLVLQIQSSVYLEQDLKELIGIGYTKFVEIGPGNTMAGFLKKTAKACGKSIQISSIDTVEDFRKVIAHE